MVPNAGRVCYRVIYDIMASSTYLGCLVPLSGIEAASVRQAIRVVGFGDSLWFDVLNICSCGGYQPHFLQGGWEGGYLVFLRFLTRRGWKSRGVLDLY